MQDYNELHIQWKEMPCYISLNLIRYPRKSSHMWLKCSARWMSDHSLCRIERCVLLSHSMRAEGALGLYWGGFDIVLCCSFRGVGAFCFG